MIKKFAFSLQDCYFLFDSENSFAYPQASFTILVLKYVNVGITNSNSHGGLNSNNYIRAILHISGYNNVNTTNL